MEIEKLEIGNSEGEAEATSDEDEGTADEDAETTAGDAGDEEAGGVWRFLCRPR